LVATLLKKERAVTDFKNGDKVKWSWGGGEGLGTICKTYTRKITLEIKGTEVTRDADEQTPAYRIEQDDGDEVLKAASELKKA
jgi:hypothetical protein